MFADAVSVVAIYSRRPFFVRLSVVKCAGGRACGARYELTPESRAHINFREQRQFGSLWKLLSELPDEPGVLPDEYVNKKPQEPRKKK